jgi:tRNA dimethylallyltransferase
MHLAKKLNTDIISADSAQLYRRLNIGTAKPTEAEQKEIQHHLLDLVEPDQNFSVADFQREANRLINSLWNIKKLPFMAGGTGLYIQAVTDSYSFGNKSASHELRSSLLKQAETENGLNELYKKLEEVDSAAASKIHYNDKRRIIRALEVYHMEGVPISRQEELTRQKEAPYNTMIYVLDMERSMLYQRIETRVEVMLEQGLLNEVQSLYREGFDLDSPAMQILGYRQMISFLKNEMSWEDTIAEIKKQTRNLAKRQLTWFRRIKEARWIKTDGNKDDLERIAEIIYNEVKELRP